MIIVISYWEEQLRRLLQNT